MGRARRRKRWEGMGGVPGGGGKVGARLEGGVCPPEGYKHLEVTLTWNPTHGRHIEGLPGYSSSESTRLASCNEASSCPPLQQ